MYPSLKFAGKKQVADKMERLCMKFEQECGQDTVLLDLLKVQVKCSKYSCVNVSFLRWPRSST